MRHALDQETRITQHTSRKMRRGWREREWVKEGEWRQTEREIQRDKERVQICLDAAHAQSVTNNNSHSEISREPERQRDRARQQDSARLPYDWSLLEGQVVVSLRAMKMCVQILFFCAAFDKLLAQPPWLSSFWESQKIARCVPVRVCVHVCELCSWLKASTICNAAKRKQICEMPETRHITILTIFTTAERGEREREDIKFRQQCGTNELALQQWLIKDREEVEEEGSSSWQCWQLPGKMLI